MELRAGTTKNDSEERELNNSMAKAMEDAFFQEWPKIMGNESVPESNDQMLLMFIAISQGVIRHLHDNPGAFQVSAVSGGGEVSEIRYSGFLY
jgi:hypothetical protein